MRKVNLYSSSLIFVLLLLCCSHPGENQPPEASIYCAGETGITGVPITLDGSGSTDAEDGADLSFAWSFTGKPSGSSLVFLNHNADPAAGFTPDIKGKYTIQLTVSDREGATDTESITLTISDAAPGTSLSSLTLSPGTLSPAFNPLTLSYAVNLGNAVDSITIKATAADAGARLEGNGTYPLVVGKNLITIRVTAADGLSESVYTIIVNRAALSASSDATLSSLSLSAGTLTPAFSSTIYSYTASVSPQTTAVSISAAANDKNATVSGDGSHELLPGVNNFTVTVTAEDGITTGDYRLSVTREILTCENIVRVTGFRQNSDQNRVACSWNNGSAADLENNTFESVAGSCCRENGDFYIGGYTGTDNATVACYWRNDARTDLENNTFDSVTTDIAVVNGTVYCTGYTKTGNSVDVACYWVNGVRKDLENNTFISRTTGIAVSGSTVVITGFTQQDSKSNRVACYWKNEVRSDLGNNSYISEALNAAVEGTDIYISGFTRNPRNYTVACYWRNGVRTDLANNTYDSKALDIDVHNATPWICGYTRNHNNYAVACVWENTTRTDLENNTFTSMSCSVIHEKDTTFVSGYTQMYNGYEVACYWKDGIRVDLAANTYHSRAGELLYY